MAVSSGISFILASILTVLLFSGMQMYRHWLASSQLHTLLGGYLGSVLFVLILTFQTNLKLYLMNLPLYSLDDLTKPTNDAVGNIESITFGKAFQTKLFPEVIMCLVAALFASGMVHRVCTTTCLIFSLLALYYINRISQATHERPAPVFTAPIKKKK